MTPKDVPVDAAGTISSSVPMAINTANPRIDTRAGERSSRMDRYDNSDGSFMRTDA
ncbi:hypothetical protein DSCW_16980 [Desulfosarcina widdelii]|uniref:Uncharacterized protein n=1 Tax=Desulfosarcina widdelii TaxID=947919 RepID=A0A5K7Z3Y5_9BACT|nr:hypothetical protein DSCW_16980 [Desulfosarcina widdelii]